MAFNPSPSILADFYKISHRHQYPVGTEYVYSTWIARSSYIPDIDHVVFFGLQAFLKKYLIDYFDEQFFEKLWSEIEPEYVRFIKHTLGDQYPETSHLRYLYELGYLPLEFRALPEGSVVPIGVPLFTVVNTDEQCFWLTNFVETLLSNEIWMPITSATIAHEYRKDLDRAARLTTGSTDGVEFQGHDFSMRGMSGLDAAMLSGMGHLLSFVGTDTMPAIAAAEYYYDANIETELVGASIPATEHSVMCAGGVDNEFDTFKRLITETYPAGFVSIVSDTWNLWDVVRPETGIMARLHDEVMFREGKVVIRPDSGDPADIICGTRHEFEAGVYAEEMGVIECLWDEFGGTTNEQGYKVLDSHVGAIYGDSITIKRQRDIIARLEAKGFASTNIVFGIGSFTYQYQTRDTFGQAQKATWVMIDGEAKPIFKDPATDKNHTKKSKTGRVIVVRNKDGEFVCFDHMSLDRQDDFYDDDWLKTVWIDGWFMPDHYNTFSQIRGRLAAERARLEV